MQIAVLILASILFVHYCLDVEFVQDDAYTSFRYAEKLAEGHGLVFNEGEKVEGYTSLLFVLILAGALKAGIDIITFAQVLSIFFGVLCLWMTWLISRVIISKLTDSKFSELVFVLLPVILLLHTGGLHYWSVSAMEYSMFVFLVLSSIYLAITDIKASRILLPAALMLAALTRPEGLIFFGMIYIYRIHTRIKESNDEGENSNLLSAIWSVRLELAIFLLPIVVHLIFRLIYYGYPLPNTFYAKTGFTIYYLERGARYLIDSLSVNTMSGIMLFLAALIIFSKPINKKIIFLFSVSFIYLTLILLIGGDVLPHHRFVLPALPLIYVLFSASILHLIQNSILNKNTILKYSTISICTVLLIIFSFHNYKTHRVKIYRSVSYEKGLVEKMTIYADWVNGQAEESHDEITVCLATIGAFSYYVNARVIDMIGLTDEYIAHNPKEVKGIVNFAPVDWDERRYNVDYVLKREPDFILFPAGAKPSAYPLVALFSRIEFLNNYYPQLFYSEKLNQHLPIFTRRDSTENSWRGSFTQNECDVKFTRPYINANNRLLRYIRTGEEFLIDSIKNDYEKVVDYCPAVESEAKTILGITYFHTDSLTEARILLEEASALDEMNCIAHVYLVNIYNELEMIEERNKHIRLLNKYSPDALGRSWMNE